MVVLPVAESPTTPRMMGRAMCSSPDLSRRRGRGKIAPARQRRPAGSLRRRGALTAAAARPATARRATRSFRGFPAESRSTRAGARCPPARARDSGGSRRRERSGRPRRGAELRVSCGSSRTWRTICGPSALGSRSSSWAPAGATTAGSDSSEAEREQRGGDPHPGDVVADPRRERDEQDGDAGDQRGAGPSSSRPSTSARSRRARTTPRTARRAARRTPAVRGPARRARPARARSPARRAAATSPARRAARPRLRTAAS